MKTPHKPLRTLDARDLQRIAGGDGASGTGKTLTAALLGRTITAP
jgi:hypothetical protein